MIKVNDKQVNKMMINGKEVLKVVLNGATKYQKQSGPWSEAQTFSVNNRQGSFIFDTNLTTVPEIVVFKIQSNLSTTWQPNISPYIYNHTNNRFITERSTQIGPNQDNYWIIYPKSSGWTQSGNEYTLKLYGGSTYQYYGNLIFNSNTKKLTLNWYNPSTTGTPIYATLTVQMALNEDPTLEEFTQITSANWTWDVKNNSNWGATPTVFNNFTLPVTYTRIKIKSFTVTSTPTYSNYVLNWKQNISSYPTTFNINPNGSEYYIIECGDTWMSHVYNTTLPSYYFSMDGNYTFKFFACEYNNGTNNRFALIRNSLASNYTAYTMNIQFDVYVKQ